jgi:hypothetical protein
MLLIHVRPGASRPGLAGFHGDRLCIRVRARPVGGAANRELIEVLARALGVRPAALSIESGASGRDKRISVQGVMADAVCERLKTILRVDKAGPGE